VDGVGAADGVRPASDKPKKRTLPSATSSPTVPATFSIGTFGGREVSAQGRP